MIIETKFNYHNVIWVVKKRDKLDKNGYFIGIEYYVEKEIVNFIMVAYNGEILGVRYTHNLYFEQDCFATKEEAQKECDKRNGK